VSRRRAAPWRPLLAVVMLAALAALAAAPAGGAAGLAAQATGGEEGERVRQAAALEMAGDLEGAQAVLAGILAERPTSLAALLAYERVLRMQGRLELLIPAVERLLAADGASALGHQLRVRTYASLDRLDELELAAESWIRSAPRLETPYREVARTWMGRGDFARAVQVLERGRRTVGRADALALELGDVAAGTGDVERGAREWERAIGPEGRGLMLVRRRLALLPDAGTAVLPALVARLAAEPVTPARQRAAVELAIEAGLAAQAEQIARATVPALPAGERPAFLVEVARRGEGAGLRRLAYWAYSELLAAGAEGAAGEQLAVRARMAELALAVGDTAAAAESYRVLEPHAAPGSRQRQRGAALRLELAAREGRLEEAVRDFAGFRAEFPEAPETDRVAAAVGGALAARGQAEEAERIVAGVSGPRSGLLRGRLALRQGDIATARREILRAAPALQGPEATEAITLATLLGRLSPAGGELIGRAAALDAAGDVAAAVTLLATESIGLGAAERAPVLDYAAGLAERAGHAVEAEAVRRTVIAEFQTGPEPPAALLALARAAAARPEGLPEAQTLLERLILDHPRSALVPQARRELNRLRGLVPHS
jgi:tetratricopeptide (TPR) repeat protein